MNWSRVSSLSEILSSAAVLVTLVYLAVQTQQTTDAIQATGRQATASIEMELLLQQAERPEVWANQFAEEYTDVEKAYFDSWLTAFFRLRELDWMNYQNNVIDARTWQSYRQAIKAVLGTPMFRTWWQNNIIRHEVFDAEFMAQVNDVIAESPPLAENPMTSWDE